MNRLNQTEPRSNGWSITKRILVGFAPGFLIAVALGAFAVSRLIVIQSHTSHLLETRLPNTKLISQIESVAIENHGLLIQSAHAAGQIAKAKANAQIQTNQNRINQLIAQYERTPDVGKPFTAFKTAWADYSRVLDEMTDSSRPSKAGEITEVLNRSEANFQQLSAATRALVAHNWTASSEACRQIDLALQTTRTGGWIGLGGAMLAGIGISVGIIRGLNRFLNRVIQRLDESSRQLAATAGEVASGSQILANGASQQAASLQETGAALEEMLGATKRNAAHARQAHVLAKQAQEAADSGAADVEAMSKAMDGIKTSSDDVAKIIKTIDEIAFQTNILALNAAVEAARAGVAGMGFAVVANEVGNLAQRSAQAAKETATKIEGAIAKTAQGVQMSSQVAEQLRKIDLKARQVNELVAQVAEASDEQSQGIEQINTSVAEIDRVTQGNAASAEESAGAAEELNAQADALKQAVVAMTLLIKGHRSRIAGKPQPSQECRDNSAPRRAQGSIAGKDGAPNPRRGGNGKSPAGRPFTAPVSGNGRTRASQDFVGKPLNCWEFKKCGREAGGVKAAELGVCPAYPDRGRDCAGVAGTLCDGEPQGEFAQKFARCLQCDFYNSRHYDWANARQPA